MVIHRIIYYPHIWKTKKKFSKQNSASSTPDIQVGNQLVKPGISSLTYQVVNKVISTCWLSFLERGKLGVTIGKILCSENERASRKVKHMLWEIRVVCSLFWVVGALLLVLVALGLNSRIPTTDFTHSIYLSIRTTIVCILLLHIQKFYNIVW